MKPVAIAFALAAFAAPAFAQDKAVVEAELKTFVASYVEAFNKGDAGRLAREFYALPGEDAAATEARFARQFEILRADSFGLMTLYGSKACVHGAAAAEVQIDFAYNYTYGGVMDPPGDLSSVLRMRKTGEGWRVVATNDLKTGQMVCAL